MIHPIPKLVPSLLILVVLLAGCDTDQRLVKQAETAAERQAEQNRQIAHQNQELSAATRRLIEADAKARQETLALARELQAESAKVAGERDQLEAERRALATARHRDPILASALLNLGLILACLLPLVLCWKLLARLEREPSELVLGELLVMELTTVAPTWGEPWHAEARTRLPDPKHPELLSGDS